jgi:hypothetical protein
MPLYARGQVLHPGSIIGHVIGLCTGFPDQEVAIATILYLMAGTFSAWLYLRYHGCKRTAAAAGAIAFACSGPFWGFWTNWNPYGWAAAMVPPTLLVIDVALAHRGSLRDGWREAILASMVFSVMLLVADPQLIVKHALLAGGYVLLRADRTAWRQGLPVLVLGAGLAACCGLAQCLAVKDYVGQSTRVSEGGVGFQDFFFMSIPIGGLFGLVDPFLQRQWYGFGSFVLRGGAISIGPLLPVVLGVFFTRAWWRRNVTRSLSVLASIALLLAVGASFPPNRLLLSVPVINNFRWPLRWTVEACTVGSLMIGLALDVMLRKIDGYRLGASPGDLGGLVRRCAIAFGIAWGIRLLLPQADDGASAGTAASSLGWFIGGGSLLAIAAAALRPEVAGTDVGRLFRILAITVALGGGLLVVPVAQRQRFADPDLRNLALNPLDVDVGEHERVLPCLAIQPQRSLDRGGNLVYGLPHQFNTRSASGYCFPLPWQGWRPFMGLQGQIQSFEALHELMFDPKRKGLLGLLRIGAVAVAADDDASRKLLEDHPDFSLQDSTDELLIFRHHGFREPAWFVEELVTVAPAPLPLHALDTPRVAVAWDARLRSPTSRTFKPGNRVIGFREHHAEIDLQVECPEEGLLVVNNTFYPGWEATVDGKPQPVALVDAGFMGLPMPQGATSVSLRYRPRWLIGLLVFSTLAWLSLATIFVVAIVPWLVRGWRATVENAVSRNE